MTNMRHAPSANLSRFDSLFSPLLKVGPAHITGILSFLGLGCGFWVA